MESNLIFVDPRKIAFATGEDAVCDLNQTEGNPLHPHAAIPRGYFNERERIGSFETGDWDLCGPAIETLLEYTSIFSVLNGDTTWKECAFVERAIKYIESGFTSRGYSDVGSFLRGREKAFWQLADSISKKGVEAIHYSEKNRDKFFDQISVNQGRDSRILFNNRGTHRLVMAKYFDVDLIPVLRIVRWHSAK